jgi:DNA polymerase-3 subunit delta'
MARLLSRLVGHQATMTSLLEASARQKLAATLLFAGPSGIGKKLAAMALAQTLVCEKNLTEACGECGACLRLEKNQSESVLIVEPEGVAIKVEQAHSILQFLQLRKIGRARVVIIDQAHLLNPQAGNALLKSLEEPPQGTHFILISSNPAAMLSTIRSRAQLVRFKPLSDDELRQVLGRVLGAPPDDWTVVSAHGSIEAAKRIEESRDSYREIENAVIQYLVSARTHLPIDEITQLKDMMKEKAAQVFVSTLVQGLVRDAMRVHAGLAPIGDPSKGKVSQVLRTASSEAISKLAELALEFEQDILRNVDRGLVLENFAIRWREAAQGRG